MRSPVLFDGLLFCVLIFLNLMKRFTVSNYWSEKYVLVIEHLYDIWVNEFIAISSQFIFCLYMYMNYNVSLF